jgi:glycosyltransferase involved in cell wall biosynthesis
VGARAGYKNFTALIDAYAGWAKRDEILLVCVGAAWQPAETRLLDERGVTGRVRLLRHIDDERLRRLYNRAVGFVYPSLEEGFGIPLLEAMACGCPIAASHIPSTLEVAGDIPLTFDPTNVDDLRSVLDRLAGAESLAARRAAGLARVQAFSWEKTAQGMLEVYRSVSQGVGAER